MPNPNIFYHGSDRPLVQYELPEIKELHTQALIKNDQDLLKQFMMSWVTERIGHRDSELKLVIVLTCLKVNVLRGASL